MDWSRAKTILIISFTLLNVLLGYQLWVSWNEQNRANAVSAQTVEELNQLLAAEQIQMQGVLPVDLPKMGYLEMEVTRMDEDWQRLSPAIDISRDEGRKDDITAALQSQIDALPDYELDEVALENKHWIYYQSVKQFPIYVAPIELKQENNKLTSYRQVSVKIISKERVSTVVSAHAALKTAVETQLIPAGSTIEEVRLGYIGQLKLQEPQFLVPVWRILAKGNEPLYINALTGGIESEGERLEQGRDTTSDRFE